MTSFHERQTALYKCESLYCVVQLRKHASMNREKHTFWGFFFEVFELWNVCIQTGHKHFLHHRAAFRLGLGHLSRNAVVKPGMHSAANKVSRYFSNIRYTYYAMTIISATRSNISVKLLRPLGFTLTEYSGSFTCCEPQRR